LPALKRSDVHTPADTVSAPCGGGHIARFWRALSLTVYSTSNSDAGSCDTSAISAPGDGHTSPRKPAVKVSPSYADDLWSDSDERQT